MRQSSFPAYSKSISQFFLTGDFRDTRDYRYAETGNAILLIINVFMEDSQLIPSDCPAENLLRQLSGKWKPQIFRLAVTGPVRFNALLRQLDGANKQSVSTALKELEDQYLLVKTTVRLKPLHIEYTLSEKGLALVPIFRQLELLGKGQGAEGGG